MKKNTSKKVNILFDLQLSVVDSLDDGRFLFTTDSNANVACYTINGLLEKNPGWKVFLLVPPAKSTTKGLTFPDKLSERVVLVNYEYFGNPFMDRMTFLTRSLSKIKEQIDIVYTNDPTKVLNYKTYFFYKQDKIIPVICRNHWVTGKANRKVPA